MKASSYSDVFAVFLPSEEKKLHFVEKSDDALESFCALIGGDGDDDDALESFCALIGRDGNGGVDVFSRKRNLENAH